MPNTSSPQNSPLQVAVRHDLSIELHNDHLSVSKKLTVDEALGLIGLLNYTVREHIYKVQLQPDGVKL